MQSFREGSVRHQVNEDGSKVVDQIDILKTLERLSQAEWNSHLEGLGHSVHLSSSRGSLHVFILEVLVQGDTQQTHTVVIYCAFVFIFIFFDLFKTHVWNHCKDFLATYFPVLLDGVSVAASKTGRGKSVKDQQWAHKVHEQLLAKRYGSHGRQI
jgi:hypothetical protein